MKSESLVREKINQVYEAVEYERFDVALDWTTELSYPYNLEITTPQLPITKFNLFCPGCQALS